MDKKNDQLLGYCGLYCGNCLYYQNTVKGTGTDVDGVITYCDGCNGSRTTPHCTICNIKRCSREKEIRYCLQCSDYPCSILNGFINDTKYSYHRDVPAMMKRLEEIGLDAWSEEMHNNYTCKKCGNEFSYFDKKCPDCKD